jgi:hypothetical protein
MHVKLSDLGEDFEKFLKIVKYSPKGILRLVSTSDKSKYPNDFATCTGQHPL